MSDMGLGLSYGAGGAGDALQQIMERRLRERYLAMAEERQRAEMAQNDAKLAREQELAQQQNEKARQAAELQSVSLMEGLPFSEMPGRSVKVSGIRTMPAGPMPSIPFMEPEVKPVTIHGVMGAPDVNVRPRTAAEVAEQQWQAGRIKAKSADVTLSPGSWRNIPGEKQGTVETIMGPPARPSAEPSIDQQLVDALMSGDTQKAGVLRQVKALNHAPATSPVSDMEVAEAARNLVNNPGDLVSIRNITSLRGDQRMKLFNEVKRLDPNFPVGMVDRQIKFLDAYEDPKGRAAINRGSMNNILMHAADLSAVNKGYRRADVRIANTAINALSRQNSVAWQAYQTPLAVLIGEIELYFAGGYAPQGRDKARWDAIIAGNATPNQAEQFAKDIVHVGLRRADTHNQQFRTMFGRDDPNLITPEAKSAAERLGMGQEVAKYGSGGSFAPQAASGGGQPGAVEEWVRDPKTGALVRR